MTSTEGPLPHRFPAWMDRLGVRYMNPWMRRIAPVLPGYAVIEHTGRKSGARYETPICVFRKDGTVAVVLLHGETDWVRNVIAAGRARLRCRRGPLLLSNPRIVGPRRATPDMPRGARLGNRMAGIIVFDID
ncbi:nitroreductase family deazaflavin-dependent oxidoreductase [Nocardia sp. NPDC003963]